tara:strand:+ start:13852 stop:14490 length:639 start_codon:yes stop_codon:yes gene_type:complete
MKQFIKPTVLTLLLSGSFLPVAAHAQDTDTLGIFAKERFQVRVRAIDVIARGDGTTGASSTDVKDSIVPEVDLTYRLNKNFALELIAATSNHDITAGGTDLGNAWILPPSLTLQYHFTPDQKFSPYVGAGINYSMFYGEDADEGASKLDVDGGFGWVLQAGADYWFNDHWGMNADVKYINLDVDVHVNNGAVNANNVKLDPVIAGVGVSYRF